MASTGSAGSVMRPDAAAASSTDAFGGAVSVLTTGAVSGTNIAPGGQYVPERYDVNVRRHAAAIVKGTGFSASAFSNSSTVPAVTLALSRPARLPLRRLPTR